MSAPLLTIGGVAGVVAVLWLLVLAVLYVGHAREVRKLRMWARARPTRETLRDTPRPAARSDRSGRRRATSLPAGGVLVGALIAGLVLTHPWSPSGTGLHGPGGNAQSGRIRVVNAAGGAGLAARAAARLRAAGLHVAGIGNARATRVSAIRYQVDDRAIAQRVARLLGIALSTSRALHQPQPGIDVLVVLGA